MCPLWPLHILLLYVLCLAPLLVLGQGLFLSGGVRKLNVNYSQEIYEKITEGKSKTVELLVNNLDEFSDLKNAEIEIANADPEIAEVWTPETFYLNSSADFYQNWKNSFNLTGKFLGYSKIAVKILRVKNGTTDKEVVAESEPVRYSVTREHRVIDKAFSYTVAILVSVAFVNMGCSLDLDVVRATLKKPVGPIIGFVCQYLFMPVCAFGLAKLLLAHNAALQLGLFVTGCSPGGGGSNMWTFVLGGNLHLSITMTCISTLAAFAMMPVWTMTLGRVVFTDSAIVVPYSKIATIAAGLAIPLVIGIGIRRLFPKAGAFLVKMLKPIAGIFILVIIGFGVYANLYMFKLMDWRVLLAGMLLPWLGYAFGAGATAILRQPWPDALAIAIETGVQNTGIAIFILRFTLEQPAADINTAVPVAVALMTPVPLLLMWVLQRLVLPRLGFCRDPEDSSCEDEKKNVKNLTGAHNISSIEKLLPNNNDNGVTVASVHVFADD